VLKQGIDTTTTAQGRLVFHVLGAIDEFRRELIVEDTLEGLASARARGRTGGRPLAMSSDQVKLARQLADQLGADGRRAYTITQVAAMLGVGRPTLYRALEPRQPASPIPRQRRPGALSTRMAASVVRCVRPQREGIDRLVYAALQPCRQRARLRADCSAMRARIAGQCNLLAAEECDRRRSAQAW
jgi:predicted DNA-binding transcriptional regulator AlpA